MFIHHPTNYKKLKIRECQTKLLSNNKTILKYCFYPKFPYSNIVFTQNFHIPIFFHKFAVDIIYIKYGLRSIVQKFPTTDYVSES